MALGVVLLPQLSAAQARDDTQAYSDMLDWGLRMLVLLALPCAVALIVFPKALAAVLFHYGQFQPQEILDAVVSSRVPKLLAGKRVLLTAGPTFEAIDPVRGITNTSSGKLGYALAQAAAEAGAMGTLVSGPTSLATPAGVNRIDVTSAAEMAAAATPTSSGKAP